MANKDIKDIIREKYLIIDTTTLAASLDMKIDTVRKIANRMGLTKRAIISNAIIDGHKKCCLCGELLPLYRFPRDRSQPNGYDYRCSKCKYKAQKSCPQVSQNNNKSCPQVSQKASKSMAFGVKKTRNPIIKVKDKYGNIMDGKKCKGCNKDKPLDAFGFANKAIGTRKNICKLCINNKYKGII